jgi:phosphate transport system permease protein
MPKARQRLSERIIQRLIFVGGITSIVLVLLIFFFVFREAIPLLKTYPLSRFLTEPGWQPTLAPPEGPWFGLLPNLWGSVLVSAGSGGSHIHSRSGSAMAERHAEASR